MTISKKIMAAITAAFVCMASLAGCSSGDTSGSETKAESKAVDTVQRGEYTLPRSVAEKLEEIQQEPPNVGEKLIFGPVAEFKSEKAHDYVACNMYPVSEDNINYKVNNGCSRSINGDTKEPVFPTGFDTVEGRDTMESYSEEIDAALGYVDGVYGTKDFSRFGFIVARGTEDHNECWIYQLEGSDLTKISSSLAQCEILK